MRGYDRESLREWADLHGHTDDYATCSRCGNARQDCDCHEHDDSDDGTENDENGEE